MQHRAESESGYVRGSFHMVEHDGLFYCSWLWELPPLDGGVMAACGACGQSYLTSPDDPPSRLFCDPCLASLEARRRVRPSTIAATPPQGGLF